MIYRTLSIKPNTVLFDGIDHTNLFLATEFKKRGKTMLSIIVNNLLNQKEYKSFDSYHEMMEYLTRIY